MRYPLNLWPRYRVRKFILILLGAYIIVCPSLVSATSPNIQLAPIIFGLNRPVAITHTGDGSGRLFITLQVGKI